MNIVYRPNFLRQYKKLSPALREEAKEKISVFQQDPKSPALKAHKLRGKLVGSYSFSVNYRYRIIFEYESPERVALLAIGDHDIYQ